MVKPIEIAGRKIGPGEPCYLIAEAGVNHNGRKSLAIELIDAAAEAGADAIKFQTFEAERLVTRNAPKADYQVRATGTKESQYEMLKALELSEDLHRQLQEHCQERGILFLSTPFDEGSADLLERLNVSAYKTPSGELTNLPFLRHVAAKGRPMIISTGMATMAEVKQALQAIKSAGNPPHILLHCVSDYPANAQDVNLRAMKTLAEETGVPIGYSDHTKGLEVAFASVALGACLIEKHLTMDRNLPGPDHAASIEPDELASLVQGIGHVQSSLGHGRKEPSTRELKTAAVARKSLVANKNLEAGTVLSLDMIDILRPGTGLPPVEREKLIGKKLKVAVPAGTLFQWDMVA